ncbi:MAG TPA: hypothetical protein VK327_07900, partial [Candidatus Paceibacterota bacterium]|nr:hypothetical protein [Candidatus Paceibacterota bacterium]
MRKLQSTLAILFAGLSVGKCDTQLLAHWRFEEVAQLNGRRSPSAVGESLTGRDNQPVGPRPFSWDDSGLRNYLQVWESRDGSNP